MAEALIGIEWIKVDEPAEWIVDQVAGADAAGVPLDSWIALTASAWQSTDGQRLTTHAPKAMKIACSAIHGVREDLDG